MSLPNYVNELDAVSRLEQVFGLSAHQVIDVIMQGFLARKSCTKHHPKTFAGYVQWAETVRALRDKTSPLGWSCTDKNNFPLCVHPDKKILIAVQTGDRDTGTSGNPSNRAPKGTNTEDAVAINQKQLSLFDIVPELPADTEIEGSIMWVLLYHVAPNEVRFELSLPKKMVGGKIRSWEERIIFPAIDTSEPNIPGNDIGDQDAEIDVPVERRQ